MSIIEKITFEEAVFIHERLTIDALESEDPISPPGIKNETLLHSAVSRQYSGFAGYLKYNEPILNAASLCYGICCNHPFHNGNKRTALVSLLCHLDKNNMTFTDRATQEDLYRFMVNVAGHNLVSKKKKKAINDQSDLEVIEMAAWIKRRTRKLDKGERLLSYNEFEKLLKQYDVHFENIKNNYADVVMYVSEKKRKNWFTYEKVRVGMKVANIPYWPGRTVGRNLVKSVRQKCGLTHADGVDSSLFYGNELTPDDFIQKYKKTLSKLAKT